MWKQEQDSLENFWRQCKENGERYIKELDGLMAKSRKKQTVVPVFRWGQSLKEIFIEVKLSHRFDSPGCLEKISPEDYTEILNVENCRI